MPAGQEVAASLGNCIAGGKNEMVAKARSKHSTASHHNVHILLVHIVLTRYSPQMAWKAIWNLTEPHAALQVNPCGAAGLILSEIFTRNKGCLLFESLKSVLSLNVWDKAKRCRRLEHVHLFWHVDCKQHRVWGESTRETQITAETGLRCCHVLLIFRKAQHEEEWKYNFNSFSIKGIWLLQNCYTFCHFSSHTVPVKFLYRAVYVYIYIYILYLSIGKHIVCLYRRVPHLTIWNLWYREVLAVWYCSCVITFALKMRKVMFWSPCICMRACYSHKSKSITPNRMKFGGMIVIIRELFD